MFYALSGSEMEIKMEKNQECIIKIEDMSLEGEGVGRLDGYALFVKDTEIGRASCRERV